MRHRKSGRHLNRTSSHLKIMLLNMACSLFKYEQIKTTLAKAKEIRRVVEPLITYSKIDTHVRRRSIFSKLHDKFIVNKLFTNIGPFFLNRSGGYVRLIKSGYRTGDKSKMAYVQLVDRNNKKTSK